MVTGIITFSFDDGRKDTYHVFKNILEPMGIPAVVYIPTGFIEIGYNNYLEIGYNGLMTKAQLDDIQRNKLFEIGGHGYMHKNNFEDISMGIKKLREWYPQMRYIGLASPHSEINRTYVELNKNKYCEMGFLYVRGGRNFQKFTKLKRGISLLARVTHSPYIFCQCYKSSINKKKDYYLNAIPIHKLTTLEQVKAIVDYCVYNKYWVIFEFHSIDKRNSKEYTEDFCWLEEDFIALCKYIKSLENKNLLEIKTPIDVCL